MIIVTIFGLIFGSFFNCAAMRIARGEDFIHGRSYCRSCGHVLGAPDLVPLISWIISKGRCRYCGQKISIRYPVSELLFSVLAAAIYLKYGFSAEAVRDWIMTGCLFTLSIVDLESYIIPDGCLIIGFLAWIFTAPFLKMSILDVSYDILAGLLCGGIMLGISLALDRLLHMNSLGGGDIKLFALMGLYLGFLGSYFLILGSSILGLVFVAVRHLLHRDKSSAAIPFGPSIALAGYIMMLFGDDITQWYISLL